MDSKNIWFKLYVAMTRSCLWSRRYDVRIGKTRGGEPLSLDRALARSRREVHPEGFPILTSSSWLIIYVAYLLPTLHSYMCFVLRNIWSIYRVGKNCLTPSSNVVTTCVRKELGTEKTTIRRISYHHEVKRLFNLIREIVYLQVFQTIE